MTKFSSHLHSHFGTLQVLLLRLLRERLGESASCYSLISAWFSSLSIAPIPGCPGSRSSFECDFTTLLRWATRSGDCRIVENCDHRTTNNAATPAEKAELRPKPERSESTLHNEGDPRLLPIRDPDRCSPSTESRKTRTRTPWVLPSHQSPAL